MWFSFDKLDRRNGCRPVKPGKNKLKLKRKLISQNLPSSLAIFVRGFSINEFSKVFVFFQSNESSAEK